MVFRLQQEYNVISKKCRQFAVDLLDERRTSEEVELLLRQDHEDKTSVQPGGQYPRLRMAIEWEIKEVSHENNQRTCVQPQPLVRRVFLFLAELL